MIRREFAAPDGTKLWLLVSQVEHARLSGELAANWNATFPSEVIEAIKRHDDGWGPWEAAPKLDLALGRPYSFLELPVIAALAIWDASIASARKVGPLAGYIVAGHFYALLAKSDHASEPLAAAWMAAIRKMRTSWLDEWLRADASHTLDVAKQALEMLQSADLFSLWLCGDCPIASSNECVLAESEKLRLETLTSRFRFDVCDFMFGQSSAGNRVGGLTWTVTVEPYPLRDSPLRLSAKAIAAPVRHYADWKEIVAVCWPVELSWRLEHAH